MKKKCPRCNSTAMITKPSKAGGTTTYCRRCGRTIERRKDNKNE